MIAHTWAEAGISSFVADRTELWWNERKPDEPTLWESKIYLSEPFFNEIIRIYAKRRVRSLCKSARAENQNTGWNRPQATPARSEPPFHRSVSLPSAPPPGGCSEPSRRDK